MAMILSPELRKIYFDTSGNPLAGGKLYTYQSGTSTPQSTYTDSGGGTANANPVVLDANGEANVWLDPALSYKFVLKNSSDVTQWTVDSVIGLLTPDAVATASLQDLSVTTAKLAADSVTAAKLADSASVDADRAVTADHIRDGVVTRAKLATGAVAKVTVTASKTTTYTATTSDDVIPCDATSGGFTVTLPAAATCSGKVLEITKTDASTNVVTVDGNASETINGVTTVALAVRYQVCRIVSDGTGWHLLAFNFPRSEVYVEGANGQGSTNTQIRRYDSAVTTVGTGITYADSAANGASFTINEAGIYTMSITDAHSVALGAHFGVSKNSNQLTTALGTITAAHRLVVNLALYSNASAYQTTGTTAQLSVGDVIRPHSGCDSADNEGVSFRITKVSS